MKYPTGKAGTSVVHYRSIHCDLTTVRGMCHPDRARDFCWRATRAFSPGYRMTGLRPFRFGGLLTHEVAGGLTPVMFPPVGLKARAEGPGKRSPKSPRPVRAAQIDSRFGIQLNPTHTAHPTVSRSSRKTCDTRSGNPPVCDALVDGECIPAPPRRASD